MNQFSSLTQKRFMLAKVSKCLVFLFLGLFLSFSIFAANISSNAVSGPWNSTASWNGGVIPAAGDNVTIVSGANIDITASLIQTGTLTINSGGTLTLDASLDMASSTTVNGTIVFNGENQLTGAGSFTLASSTNAFLNIGSANGITVASASGNIVVTGGRTYGQNATYKYIGTTNQVTGDGLPATIGALTINNTGTAGNNVVSLTTSGTVIKANPATGILTLTAGIFDIGTGNNIQFNNNSSTNGIENDGGDLASTGTNGADGGTVIVLSGSGANFNINGSNSTTFYNLQIGTSTGNGNRHIIQNAGVLINGTLTLQDNQVHWQSGSPIYGPNATLYLNNNGQGLNAGNGPGTANQEEWLSMVSGTIGVTPGYPNNVTVTNLGTSQGGSHNGNGWVPTNSYAINGVFTIGDNITNGQFDFSGVPSFTTGGFVLNSNSRFTAPTGTMTVNGSWADNQPVSGFTAGFFINGTSTINFGGGSCGTPATISATSGNETFYNMGVVGGYTSLSNPVTVTNGLALAAGIIDATNNTLSVTNTSTSAITGGGTGNYINGRLAWNVTAGANTYNFPVGAGCNTYLPFVLNKSAGSALTATTQAFNTNSGGTTDGTLSSISTTEYWSLATSVSLAAGSRVSITRPSAITPFTYVAESSTQSGVYTSLGGTTGANGVTNSNDIGTGASFFFTFGAPPIVSTFNASSITTTSVTLNGGFNTQGSSLATSFNWGTTIAYGSNVPALNSPFNTNVSTPDSAHLTGLTANTLYHYQATDGANSGNDVIFITAPNPPTVGVGTAATGNGFTANWTAPAVPGTATYTYTVEVSTDSTFASIDVIQSNIPSGTLSYTFTTLASGTTYYYRVRADNATASSVWSANSPPISTSISQTVGSCTTGSGGGASPGSIVQTFTAPVIDGNIDSIWTAIPANNISTISVPAPGPTNGNTRTWKAMWTTDSLYFLVQVTDPTLISQNITLPNSTVVPGATPGTSNNYYDFDGVEIELDPFYSHNAGSYDALNDVQFRFNLGGLVASGQSCGCATQFTGSIFDSVQTHIDYKVVPTGSGYIVEAAIPFGQGAGNPGINRTAVPATYSPAVNGENIGVEVQVNDANSITGRNSQYSWFNSSSAPYQDASQFAKATLTTCVLPPQVINPTVTAITATGATLGATVVSSGDALLTGRGTGYTPSPDNSGTGNPLLEGGTTLGVYSGPARTGLSPQTKYYFTGYATNASNETGVSNVDSFFTLSALPTVQASGFSVSGCGPLTLNWTPATFPAIGQATETGYLILRATAPAVPTATGIVTRVAATQSELSPGVTLLTTINSGAIATYNDVTAVSGVTYNYLLVPFTWDGVATDSTYNFDTTAAPQTSGSFTGNTVTLSSAAGTDNQSFCSTGSPITTITYSITGTATGATVTGLPTGVNGVYASGTVTITGSPSVTGIFNYTVTTTGGCGVGTANGTISIASPATVNLTSASGTDAQTVCISTAITPITYGTTGATGANVTGLPTGVSGSYASGVVTISGTPTTASGSPFTYTVTTTGGCGSPATTTGTITVTPAAAVALATGSASQTVCVNTAITPITYNVSNATSATVTGLPTGVSGSYASGVVTISGTPTTTAGSPFVYTVTTTGGCGVATANGTITVNGNATATLSSAAGTDAQEACVNTTALTPITYNVTGATGATVTGLPTGVTGSYAGGVVTISGTPTTAVGSPFTYTLTTTGGCGVATANGSVTVNSLPIANITSVPLNDTTDGVTPITLTETAPASTYSWSVVAPPSGTITTGSSTAIATATPAVTTIYRVDITDGNGCPGFAEQTVVVIPTTCVVPNAFTPNGDAYDQLWVVNSGCFFSVDASVYNRWGSLVYHAENYQNDWDGTYQGKQLPDGTYYYVLTVHRLNGSSYTQTGNVTIMR
jgi:gliding motility-associated-like protein